METPAAVLAALAAEVSDRSVPRGKEIEALSELFDLFTRGRSRIGRESYIDVPRLRRAYLRAHVPLNVARALHVLRHVRRLDPAVDDLPAVVDLGSGPGSASLASLSGLTPTVSRTYHLFDRSRAALAIARRLLARSAAALGIPLAHAVRSEPCSLPRLPPFPRRALVWLSMVINETEVGRSRRSSPQEFLDNLRRRLEAPSTVIIIEPALRAPGRSLLRLHDAVARGGWRVVAPCTHQRLCPLLAARGSSWCHFRFEWQVPALAREIAAPLGLFANPPSLAFLVLRRVEEPPPADGSSADVARVIGDAMPLRSGKTGIYLCQDGERRLARLAGVALERGDIVRVAGGGEPRRVLPWEPEG
jgi:hypothetical protein